MFLHSEKAVNVGFWNVCGILDLCIWCNRSWGRPRSVHYVLKTALDYQFLVYVLYANQWYFYSSSSETNRIYTASQKRSTCWPGGFSVILAMVLQVKEYSGDTQITNFKSSRAENHSIVLYIASCLI